MLSVRNLSPHSSPSAPYKCSWTTCTVTVYCLVVQTHKQFTSFTGNTHSVVLVQEATCILGNQRPSVYDRETEQKHEQKFDQPTAQTKAGCLWQSATWSLDWIIPLVIPSVYFRLVDKMIHLFLSHTVFLYTSITQYSTTYMYSTVCLQIKIPLLKPH